MLPVGVPVIEKIKGKYDAVLAGYEPIYVPLLTAIVPPAKAARLNACTPPKAMSRMLKLEFSGTSQLDELLAGVLRFLLSVVMFVVP